MDSPRTAATLASAPPAAPGARGIDVVIPVYNAAADLARCVESVLAHTARDDTLVLIDDASPDPAIGACFDDLARRGLPRLVLLRNDVNLGFTATANRGLRRSRADVVLLNSDTIVTGGWLDALARCVASDPRIGTATPFSNNAEICSFPRFCANNPWPAGDDAGPVAHALACSAVPSYPDLPTGVGFCLYVRRALVDRIGVFDPAFGHGYGEENDYCLRAAQAGFRNVLCDDAFVLHTGERSFAGRKAELGPRNMELLVERHPGYLDLVGAYVAADPLRPIRAAALARQRVLAGPACGVLHLLHGDGGGTLLHAQMLIDGTSRHLRHYLAIAVDDVWRVEERQDDGEVRSYRFERLPGEAWREFIGGLCATFGIGLIHVHHVSGCREGILAALGSLSIPYGLTLHDLHLACPTITLRDAGGSYCGAQTDPAACSACLAAQPAFAAVDIVAWRARHRAALAGAAFLMAPSQWVARTLALYFPEHATTRVPLAAPGVVATATPSVDDARLPAAVPDDGVPTVAVLGAIGPDKGARRIERMVELVRSLELRLRFVVIGFLDRMHEPSRSDDAVLTIHGRYAAGELPALLDRYRVRLVAFPSTGPEAFSFTLSESWAAGRPVVVPPIGALAERVAGSRAGWILTDDEWRDDERMLLRIAQILAPANAAQLDAAGAEARVQPQPLPEAMAESCLACYAAALRTAAAVARAPAVPGLAPARVLAALGYVPWQPPQAAGGCAATDDAAVAATGDEAVAPEGRGTLKARVARVALRWGATAPGRAIRRLTPAPLLEALKARLL